MHSYRLPGIEQMRQFIRRYNELQSILNEDIFGPLENDSVLIVVQVHTRINYLRHLIVSLAQARDISRSLIIFSHDYYDEDINDLIQSIDFCKVMQVSIEMGTRYPSTRRLNFSLDFLPLFDTDPSTWISWGRTRRLSARYQTARVSRTTLYDLLSDKIFISFCWPTF